MMSSADIEVVRDVVHLFAKHDSEAVSGIDFNHIPESLLRSPAKAEILVHAMLVFIEKGIERTTVQNILDRADISRRTFYKYFSNKLDVLDNLYRLSVDIMTLRMASEAENASSINTLASNLVAAYFNYHVDLGPVIKLMLSESLREGSPLAVYREAGLNRTVEIINSRLGFLGYERQAVLVVHSCMWVMERASVELLNKEQFSLEDIEMHKSVISEVVFGILKVGLTAAS